MLVHDRARWSGPFKRAVALARAHPQVIAVNCRSDGCRAALDMAFRVNLPSESKVRGESPLGVRQEEPVRFDFPRDYPIQAPEPSLRTDFSRNHPHMQPWLTDGRPVPCIYDGHARELFHREGFAGILNQTALWLDRAAAGTLIDPNQGWEPVRRDSFGDYLIADADRLRLLAIRRRGYRFYGLTYLKIDSKTGYIYGRVSDNPASVDRGSLPNAFSGTRSGLQNSLAIVVWPAHDTSGRHVICDAYLPETVGCIGDLNSRAYDYGCAQEFDNGLTWLKLCFSRHRQLGSFTLAVVLLVHRPYQVIGSESTIELCPYVIDVVGPDHFAAGDATPVRPAAHLDPVSCRLLSRMSGEAMSERRRWTLIGAGSLGSKIALHLARAGHGPEVVVDNEVMTPHNAARHALMPSRGTKARLLCASLSDLDQKADPVVADATTPMLFESKGNGIWSCDSWALVNATASLAVHEAVSAARRMPTRTIEMSMFAGGRIGLITAEGPARNPGSGDLMAEFYAGVRETPALASEVFARADTISRQAVGQGCGSLTMPMSDGRVSLFAAGMAEYLLAMQREGLPGTGGEILIGRLSDAGLGVRWESTAVASVIVIADSLNGEHWSIHVHARADARMHAEVARWPDLETGGVLVGRISEASRTVHIVDVVDAPEDSVRSADEFVLGTRGLHRQLAALTIAVDCSLYCLGTWHSHLGGGSPSETDRATAKAVSLARLTPSVFLIRATDGYHTILADGAAAADASAGQDERTC